MEDDRERGSETGGDKPQAVVVETPRNRGIAGVTARVVLVAAAIAVALAAAYLLRSLLLVLFLAVVVAASLFPAVNWLEKHKVPRLLAVVIPYVGILAFMVGAGFLIVPPLVQQVSSLLNDLPNLVQSFQKWASSVLNGLGFSSTDQIWQRVSSELQNAIPNLGTLLQIPLTVVGVIGKIAILIITSFLMVLQRDRIKNWLKRFVPQDKREEFVDVSATSLHQVGRYMLGQLIVMSAVGVGTGLAMFILGIPFALPIGLLGFFGEIVPYIGPIVAGVPAALLGFLESPLIGLIMTAWLLILQELEGHVLSPVVQHRVLRVSPLAVVIAVVVGLSLFGILGALVAVPLVAIIDVVLENVVFPTRQRRDRRVAGRIE